MNSGGGGPWVLKSGYTIYHSAGTLISTATDNQWYAQLYFYNPQEALDYCMRQNPTLNRTTMKLMQNMLLHEKRYSTLFCHVFELLQTTPSRELGIHLLADPVTDLRHYNEPTIDEIAIVVPGEQAHAVDSRNIV